jgi:hypothetical protein
MNSIPRRVLEYWHRADKPYTAGNKIINWAAYSKWIRAPSLEVDAQQEGDKYFPWAGHSRPQE